MQISPKEASRVGVPGVVAESQLTPTTLRDVAEVFKDDRAWGPLIAAASKAFLPSNLAERQRPPLQRYIALLALCFEDIYRDLDEQNYFARNAPYIELLKSLACSDSEATVLPYSFQKFGHRFVSNANDARRRLKPLIKKLETTTRNDLLVKSRACAALLAALENPEAVRLVTMAIEKSDLRKTFAEFRAVLSLVASRDSAACLQLKEIAKRLSEHLPDARGRDIALSVGVHMFLLHELHLRGEYIHFKYDDEDYVDEITRATRTVMQHTSFDPRESTRRLREYVPAVAKSIDRSNLTRQLNKTAP